VTRNSIPPNTAQGGNTIARYDVLYLCTACRRIHPMGVSLPLEVGFLNTKTVSEAYSGKPLPSYVAMLGGSSVTCRKTGKSFVLENINKLYLTPVLKPLSRESKRA
jgi:hypothetical protein